jgi:hypothetical protein
MGFVVRGPYGVFLDPDFPQHLFNELGLQTGLAPYLGLGIGRVLKLTHLLRTDQGVEIGNWIARNVNLELPNFRNGYRPGVGVTVNVTPRLTISGKFTARCSFCQERSDDFSMPIRTGSRLELASRTGLRRGSRNRKGLGPTSSTANLIRPVGDENLRQE